MRVISGSAKSLPLKTVKGDATRPTTDRIKETLFNMLSPYIPGCRFLDLFAGSGAIGIEALSRGASFAVFCDNQKEAVSCIKENLLFTGLSGKAGVLQADVFSALKNLEASGTEAFDVVFMDPPYGKEFEKEVLLSLKTSPLVNGDTLFIFEADLKTDISWILPAGFSLIKDKQYKTNRHVWLRITG